MSDVQSDVVSNASSKVLIPDDYVPPTTYAGLADRIVQWFWIEGHAPSAELYVVENEDDGEVGETEVRCLYRKGNTACAIGCCIPDKYYNTGYERNPASLVMEEIQILSFEEPLISPHYEWYKQYSRRTSENIVNGFQHLHDLSADSYLRKSVSFLDVMMETIEDWLFPVRHSTPYDASTYDLERSFTALHMRDALIRAGLWTEQEKADGDADA